IAFRVGPKGTPQAAAEADPVFRRHLEKIHRAGGEIPQRPQQGPPQTEPRARHRRRLVKRHGGVRPDYSASPMAPHLPSPHLPSQSALAPGSPSSPHLPSPHLPSPHLPSAGLPSPHLPSPSLPPWASAS